ncbi:MAG: hypothetical protein EA356_04655 [Geminicoccaceae bacterium]|nr:MAG: hypothetical protein EA356_04655 [Geminicoccaceae bacterium]
MRVARNGCVVALGLVLVGCGGGLPPAGSLVGLKAMQLAETCRLDEAMAAAEAEVAAATPGTLRHAAALQEQAVLHRDRNRDDAAEALEARIAQATNQPAEVVRGDTLRDVAALRQRRAATYGRPGC